MISQLIRTYYYKSMLGSFGEGRSVETFSEQNYYPAAKSANWTS